VRKNGGVGGGFFFPLPVAKKKSNSLQLNRDRPRPPTVAPLPKKPIKAIEERADVPSLVTYTPFDSRMSATFPALGTPKKKNHAPLSTVAPPADLLLSDPSTSPPPPPAPLSSSFSDVEA